MIVGMKNSESARLCANRSVLLSALLLCMAIASAAGSAFAAEDGFSQNLSRTWTVRESVRFALANNPDSKVALSRIEVAQATVTMEEASFYPQVSVNSVYSQTNTPMHSFGNILNQGAFDQSIDFNNPGRTDNLNVNVRLGYRFFNGLRDLAGLTAAQAHESAARMEAAAVRSQLSFEVVRAFNRIVQAQGLVRAYESTEKSIGAMLEVARLRRGEGMLLRADVLDLEVQQSQARENLLQARHGLALSRNVFATLLGIGAQDVVIDMVEAYHQEIPEGGGFDERYELKAMSAMIRGAEARVLQAKGGYLPTIDGYAGYGADNGYVLDGSGDSWEAGVKLQYNLFDGQRTSAEVARAHAQLVEAKDQKRKTELAIGLEVEQAQLALRNADERLLVMERTVEQAQESARINRERFSEGLVLSADIIAVENRLTDAMVRRTFAETARRVAVADLRRAIGLDQFPDQVEQ